MEKRYKEIDGVRYQVIQNTILGSNVVPVGESLPEVTTSDSGKLLGVDSSGEWVPVEAPKELPSVAGNAGKVLKVNAGATGTEWANETYELPAVTSEDAGDVLTVNASGEWEAAAPASGGLTLYGPYTATHFAMITIAANDEAFISLDMVANIDEDACDISNIPEGTIFLPYGFYYAISSGSSYEGLTVINAVSQPITISDKPCAGYFDIINESSNTVYLGAESLKINFYSTYEIPLSEND